MTTPQEVIAKQSERSSIPLVITGDGQRGMFWTFTATDDDLFERYSISVISPSSGEEASTLLSLEYRNGHPVFLMDLRDSDNSCQTYRYECSEETNWEFRFTGESAGGIINRDNRFHDEGPRNAILLASIGDIDEGNIPMNINGQASVQRFEMLIQQCISERGHFDELPVGAVFLQSVLVAV